MIPELLGGGVRNGTGKGRRPKTECVHDHIAVDPVAALWERVWDIFRPYHSVSKEADSLAPPCGQLLLGVQLPRRPGFPMSLLSSIDARGIS